MNSHKIFNTALISALSLGGSVALAQEAPVPAQEQVSPDVKEINWVGFQQLADSSLVFIKTNDTVRYNINPSSETEIILTVFNSYLVTKTLEYPLDCSFFDSPVLSIKTESFEDITP